MGIVLYCSDDDDVGGSREFWILDFGFWILIFLFFFLLDLGVSGDLRKVSVSSGVDAVIL